MATIEAPTLFTPQHVTGNWVTLPSFLPVPGFGVLPVNSFLWKGPAPMLVDTGLAALSDGFIETLAKEIDPFHLRWIWLSHTDADHIGNLQALMDRAPDAKVVTNFLGMGKMNLLGLDVSRVHLLNPGDKLTLAGRDFIPVRPPYYDAPETMGLFDPVDRVFFAADSFGALLPEPANELSEIAADKLRDGLVAWSSIDAPWLAEIDSRALGHTLSAIERLDPDFVLSGHLPLTRKGVGKLTRLVADAYGNGTTDAAGPLSFDHLLAQVA